MITSIKNVSLSFNCKEDWNAMTPCLVGKFCSSCSKQVYDFSDKGPEELAKVLSGSKGVVCGRFRYSQLADKKSYFSFFQRILASMVVFFGLTILEARAQGGLIRPVAIQSMAYHDEVSNLARFMEQNIDLEESKHSGKIELSFCVDTLGTLSHFQITKGNKEEINQPIYSAIQQYYSKRKKDNLPIDSGAPYRSLTFTVRKSKLFWKSDNR